jgi:hypothetical protein
LGRFSDGLSTLVPPREAFSFETQQDAGPAASAIRAKILSRSILCLPTAQQERLTARELYNVSVLMAMFIWGHSLQVRDVRDMFAYPPELTVTADIPGRQLRATSGREQPQ